MPRKKKTQLQAYLSKPLPPFRRGSADCCAWVAGWANILIGEEVIKLKPITFGEAKRRLRESSVSERAEKFLRVLKFKEIGPLDIEDGDILVYEHSEALSGLALGVSSGGVAMTRMEGQALDITKKPIILKAWRFSS